MKCKSVYLDLTHAVALPDHLYFDAYDVSLNGIIIEANNDEIPMAYDAGINIKGDNLVISGGFGPSGYGRVEISLPKKDVMGHYTIYIEKLREKEEEFKEWAEEMKKYNWNICEKPS